MCTLLLHQAWTARYFGMVLRPVVLYTANCLWRRRPAYDRKSFDVNHSQQHWTFPVDASCGRPPPRGVCYEGYYYKNYQSNI